MLLQETTAALCETPLFKYSPQTDSWELQEQTCQLASYDRFISDRAFGQKKRVMTVPGHFATLPQGYFRIGHPTVGPVYIWESVNLDVDKYGPYLQVYMLRHLPNVLKVFTRQVVETLPTLAERTALVENPQQHWCDLDFYSTSQSEQLNISNAQFILIGLSLLDLPKDCILKVVNEAGERTYRIAERYRMLQGNHYRVVPNDG